MSALSVRQGSSFRQSGVGGPGAGLAARLGLAMMLFWMIGIISSHAADPAWQRAVARNQIAVLDRLLGVQERAGRVDERAADGKTGLMAAAAAGNAALLRRFVQAGADPFAVNAKGASALLYAAWRGDVDTVGLLIALGLPLEQAASNGWTAMTMAAAKGHVAAIRQLLSAQARVDPPDVYGWTPLMRACNLGRAEVAQVLVTEGGADLARANASGQTALHLAAAAGHRQLYELLRSLGARDDPRDANGHTPASIAAQVFSRNASGSR